MAMKGAASLVKASATAGGAGAYTTVAEIRSATMNLGAGEIDVAAFGSVWDDLIQGLKNVTFSLTGFYKPGDTDGQIAFRDAFINDTEVWVQFLPDGTNGFKAKVLVSKFDVDTSVENAVNLSIELKGKGAIVAVP